MSWWIWVLIVLGGLVVLLVAVVILDPFWYQFKERHRVKKHLRELDKMTPEEREAQRQMDEYRRSERAMGMAVSADPTLSMRGFADLVSSGDIEGLRQTFSLAQSFLIRTEGLNSAGTFDVYLCERCSRQIRIKLFWIMLFPMIVFFAVAALRRELIWVVPGIVPGLVGIWLVSKGFLSPAFSDGYSIQFRNAEYQAMFKKANSDEG